MKEALSTILEGLLTNVSIVYKGEANKNKILIFTT